MNIVENIGISYDAPSATTAVTVNEWETSTSTLLIRDLLVSENSRRYKNAVIEPIFPHKIYNFIDGAKNFICND